MADESADAPTPAVDAVPPNGRPRPKLALHSQFLQDLSFENPRGVGSFANADAKPRIKVDLNVDSRRLGEALHEVALSITARATIGEEPCFLVEVDYRGVFSLAGVDGKAVSQALLIEGPRILFPFARRIVADAVRDGGFPPLMLEPVDFAGFYRRNAAGIEARIEAGKSGAEGDGPLSRPAAEPPEADSR